MIAPLAWCGTARLLLRNKTSGSHERI